MKKRYGFKTEKLFKTALLILLGAIILFGQGQVFPPASSGSRIWQGCTGPGLGDGLNAVTAGTYLLSGCYNNTGSTITLTGIKCYSDNNGTTTGAVANGAGTALLTGAVTATNSWAAGTQSGTTTIANDDYLKFTWVADGTSKQFACEVKGTY